MCCKNRLSLIFCQQQSSEFPNLDWLQVFESHGGYLTKDLFLEFALPCLKQIRDNVQKEIRGRGYEVPMIIFGKDCHYVIKEVIDLGYEVVGLDWTMDPRQVREIAGQALQGNMDPCALYSQPEALKRVVRDMVESFGKERYIANLGHGIYPDVDPKNVKVFVDAVHEYSNTSGV